MQRWLVPSPSAPAADAEPVPTTRARGKLSKPELDLLESTTVMFRRWDAQCGGGLRRKAVVGQLHEVTDLLQEPQPGPTRAKLFQVAAELAELAGCDVVRHRAPAHRAEVLRPRPARRQGGR
ncbi:hypothetical protein SFUMM280S_05554 [Streptomyces fumanus]